MRSERPSRDDLREHMRVLANRQRDVADEMARMYDGCDDPLHPSSHAFRDWEDFVARVARPLVESGEDVAAEQAAMALYRQASPFGICLALVLACNRLEAGGGRLMGSGPVEIVTATIPTNEATARRVLGALAADGWRLVRPGPCTNPDAALGECGCSGIFFAEEWTGQ